MATTTLGEFDNVDSDYEQLRRGPYWYRHMPELGIPEYWQKFPPRSDIEHELLGYLIIVLAFLSLCGNGCVIYVFTRTKTLRTPSNALIVNLAVSDFLMMLTQCPIYVTNSFHHRWALPAYMCPFMAFTGAVFGIASIMSMTAVAVDRYLVICRPFLMLRSQMTRDRAKYAILFVWLYSLAWSLPPYLGYSRYVPEGFMTTCSYDYLDESFTSRSFIFSMAIGAYFVPLITVIICYVMIVAEVRKSERKFARKTRAVRSGASSGDSSSDEASSAKEHRRRRKEVQIAKVIFMVIICWVIAWTPYLIVSLMGIFFMREMLTPLTSQVPALFAKSGSVYNPLVYAISHPKYREAVRKHFPFLVCFPVKRDGEDTSNTGGEKSGTGSRLANTKTISSAASATASRTHDASDADVGGRTEYEEVEIGDIRRGKAANVSAALSDADNLSDSDDDDSDNAKQKITTVTRIAATKTTTASRSKKDLLRATPHREVETEDI